MTGAGHRQHQGLSLLELMIALGLGASLTAAILQLFVSNIHIQSLQNQHQGVQQRAAYARQLLRTAIQDVKSPLCSDVIYDPPRLRWHMAPFLGVDAAPGTSVLEVVGGHCETPVSIFYIGYRGANDNNRPGLYRRQRFADGRFRAAEELVEGVSSLRIVAVVEQFSDSGSERAPLLAYVTETSGIEGFRVRGIELQMLVMPLHPLPEAGDLTLAFSVPVHDGY